MSSDCNSCQHVLFTILPPNWYQRPIRMVKINVEKLGRISHWVSAVSMIQGSFAHSVVVLDKRAESEQHSFQCKASHLGTLNSFSLCNAQDKAAGRSARCCSLQGQRPRTNSTLWSLTKARESLQLCTPGGNPVSHRQLFASLALSRTESENRENSTVHRAPGLAGRKLQCGKLAPFQRTTHLHPCAIPVRAGLFCAFLNLHQFGPAQQC